jgi:hypothetical protein
MSKRTNRPRKSSATKAPFAAAALALLAVPAAQAATFTVTTTADSGPGSLRQAVANANATAGADVITFQPTVTGTIVLTSGELQLTDSVDVQGPGAGTLAVSGNDSSRVFFAYIFNILGPGFSPPPIDVVVSGLTITHGKAAFGGGVASLGNRVTLDHVTITNNTADYGGGVGVGGAPASSLTIQNTSITGNTSLNDAGGVFVYYPAGPTLIEDTIVSGNHSAGAGGGIAVDATGVFPEATGAITIRRTTISGNTADTLGGGLSTGIASGQQLLIESSTISGNTTPGLGGGAYFHNTNGAVTITDSTIAGNTGSSGGGIAAGSTAPLSLRFSTVAGNTAVSPAGGGNIANTASAVLLNDSIVADGVATANPDVSGTFVSSYSLIETPGTAGITAGAGTITGVDPQLGPLANNGGPTRTKLPAATSPAVDAGNPAYAPPPATDQRGLPRLAGFRVDMGAVELQAVVPPANVPAVGVLGKLLLAISTMASALWMLGRRE